MAKKAKKAEEAKEYPDPDYNNLDGTVADMTGGHVTDGSPCPRGPTTEVAGGFKILAEEPESRRRAKTDLSLLLGASRRYRERWKCATGIGHRGSRPAG